MIYDMYNEPKEAEHKCVPALRLLVEAALDEFSIDVGKGHSAT